MSSVRSVRASMQHRPAVSEAEKRIHGTDVDNGPATAARKHGSALVLQTQKGTLQIDVENSVPLLLRQIGDPRKLPFDAGVVHRVVQLPNASIAWATIRSTSSATATSVTTKLALPPRSFI